jgi:ectoine hydroxylase-related dioxygenase (phytanoyl-CoA dioxygenase family)
MSNNTYLNPISDYDDIRLLKSTMSTQGYVFIKSFFPKDQVNAIKEQVTSKLLEQGWCQETSGKILPIEPVNRIGSKGFIDYITSIMQQEIVHEFCESKTLASLMNVLIEGDAFSHPRKMVRITYPYRMNPDDLILPHQDLFYVKGEKDTLVAWVPLGNYPPICGGLKVAHGSHARGLYSVKSNKEGRFNCAVSDLDSHHSIDWRTAHYEIGDLLVMHSLTMHGSGENHSEEFRLSLDCRFSASDGFINEEQLLPPYYPKVPDWNKLSDNWSNKHFELPSSLKVESVNTPLDKVLDRDSLYSGQT